MGDRFEAWARRLLMAFGLSLYTDEHLPPHVHGRYGETTVIIDLLPERKVARSGRKKSVIPTNAKRSDVRRILKAALDHAAELHEIWETMHGTPID